MSDPDTASTSREDETTLREKDVSFQHIAGISLSIHMGITGVGGWGVGVGVGGRNLPANICWIDSLQYT